MLSLIILLLVGFVAADQDLLAGVCNEKSGSITILDDVQQVRGLIATFKLDSGPCAEKFAESFTQLELILSEDNLKDVCSNKSVDQIEAYHSGFIHFFSPTRSTKELKELKKRKDSGGVKAIPKALYQFFIMFAKHVSAKCRSQIPKRIREMDGSQKWINDKDFELFNQIFSSKKGASKRILSRLTRFISFQSIGALLPPISGVRLNLAIPDKTVVPRLQQLCQAKFRPVYEEILVAVVRLNSLGYSGKHYVSQEIKAALKSAKVVRWYQAYQICEVLRGISLVVVPKETCKTKRRCYGFLSDEEATEWRATKAVQPDLGPIETVRINHEPVELDGFLSHYRGQSDADSAVQKFKSHVNRQILKYSSKLFEIDMKFNEKLLVTLGLRPIPKGDCFTLGGIYLMVVFFAILFGVILAIFIMLWVLILG